MLRHRIELLERVLHAHGIDADASIAQLMADNDSPPQSSETSGVAGYSPSVNELCMTFEGALTLDESLNFDQDGEVRYFGPTSGRLSFRSSMDGPCLFFIRASGFAKLVKVHSPKKLI